MGLIKQEYNFYFTDDEDLKPSLEATKPISNDDWDSVVRKNHTLVSLNSSDWKDNATTAILNEATGAKYILILTTGPIFCWHNDIVRDGGSPDKITNAEIDGFQIDDFYVCSGSVIRINAVHKNANVNNGDIKVRLVYVY